MAGAKVTSQPDRSWMKETGFSFIPGEEPEGFNSVHAGDKVTITITGKVKSITSTEGGGEYDSSSITVTRSSLTFEGGSKKTTMDEAIRRTRRQA